MSGSLRLNLDPFLWCQILVLLVVGLVVLSHPVMPLYLTGLVAVSLMGLVGLLRCVVKPREVSLWDLAVVSMCLGYGVGTLNTEINWIFMLQDYLSVTDARPESIARMLAWLMLLAAFLLALGSMDSLKVFAIEWDDQAQGIGRVMVILVAIAAVVQVGTGAIGYHQDMTGDGVRVSPLAAITVSAICPALAIGIFCLPRADAKTRQILLLSLIVLLMIQFYQGRRVFIYSVVLMLMCYSATQSPRHWFSPKNLLLIVLAVAAMAMASKAFYALRMAKWELGDSAKDVKLLIQTGAEILFDAKRSGLNEELSENQKSRTFIIGYPAEILEALDDREPLGGQLLVFDVALTVPSVLWPNKYRVVSLGSEETIANPQLGLRVSDEANSLISAGLSDFGVPGIFLYTAAIVLIFRFLIAFVRRFGSLPLLFCSATFANALLNVEAAMADYFNVLRGLIILAIVVGLLTITWRSCAPFFYRRTT